LLQATHVVPRACAQMHNLSRGPPHKRFISSIKLQRLYAVKQRVRKRSWTCSTVTDPNHQGIWSPPRAGLFYYSVPFSVLFKCHGQTAPVFIVIYHWTNVLVVNRKVQLQKMFPIPTWVWGSNPQKKNKSRFTPMSPFIFILVLVRQPCCLNCARKALKAVVSSKNHKFFATPFPKRSDLWIDQVQSRFQGQNLQQNSTPATQFPSVIPLGV
jgi:hypothetical protein